MADLDRLLTPDISRAAEKAAQRPDFTGVERRGTQSRRVGAVVVTTAATVVVVVISVGLSLAGGNKDTAPSPAPEPTTSQSSLLCNLSTHLLVVGA